MPDMNDPLLQRIRSAADVSAPTLDATLIKTPDPQGNRVPMKITIIAAAAALVLIGFSIQPSGIGKSPLSGASYGEHDSYPFEDYSPAWNLGWFGSSGTAYELKVKPDISIREAELRRELSDADKTKLGGLSLDGFGGQWLFTASELFNPAKAKGSIPSQDYVKNAATRIFVSSGFEGDLNSMKFQSDSETITARVRQTVGGQYEGLTYSVTFMRGNILWRATGWLVNVVEHKDLPTLSAREAVSKIQWRTVNADFPFRSLTWEGESNPSKVLVGWEEDLPPMGYPPAHLKQKHLTITASSKSMVMTRTMLGQAWIVPSFYLASGKTVIGNYPAISEDTLRSLQR
jgi:hypothetical protein